MSEHDFSRRSWDGLDADEQTDLQVAFGVYQDGLPPTCSLTVKVRRFRHWLDDLGIDYDGAVIAARSTE